MGLRAVWLGQHVLEEGGWGLRCGSLDSSAVEGPGPVILDLSKSFQRPQTWVNGKVGTPSPLSSGQMPVPGSCVPPGCFKV